MKSTIGRPRALTDQQVKIILEWHARFRAWQALRKELRSQRQLAKEFGVSQGTISQAIRRQGGYKQPPPERRAEVLLRRRSRGARLGKKGSP